MGSRRCNRVRIGKAQRKRRRNNPTAATFAPRVAYKPKKMKSGMRWLLEGRDPRLQETPWVLGFDAKYCRENERTALIQLATARKCLLAHVHKHNELPEALRWVLQDRNMLKVGVGVYNDAKALKRDFGVSGRMRGLVDLEPLARAFGHEKPSLRALARLAGVRIRKCPPRTTRWEDTPLREGSVNYAARNAYAGLQVLHYLHQQYARQGDRSPALWASSLAGGKAQRKRKRNNATVVTFAPRVAYKPKKMKSGMRWLLEGRDPRLQETPWVLGFDAEYSYKEKGKGQRTALIQLATARKCLLAHVHKHNELPEALRWVLQDRNLLKVGVGVFSDAKALKRDFGESGRMRGLVDLQPLARAFGHDQANLRELGRLAGVSIPRVPPRSAEWKDRPLREGKMNYAAMDAYAGLQVLHYLHQQYARQGDGSPALWASSLADLGSSMRHVKRFSYGLPVSISSALSASSG